MPAPPRAYLALICTIILWSSSLVAAKYAFSHYHIMPGVFIRMAIALLGFAFLRRQWRGTRLAPGDLKWVLLMGLCQPCLVLSFEANALLLTSAAQAGVVNALCPLITALAAGLILKERLSPTAVAGLLLALGGVIGLSAISQTDEMHAPNPWLGNTLEFIGVCWGSLFLICVRRLSPRYPAVYLAFMGACCGFVFFLPPAALIVIREGITFNGPALLALAYLALGVTIAGMVSMNLTLKELPASSVAGFMNLMPVGTLFMSYFFLNETLSGRQYLLVAVILLGVFISQRQR